MNENRNGGLELHGQSFITGLCMQEPDSTRETNAQKINVLPRVIMWYFHRGDQWLLEKQGDIDDFEVGVVSFALQIGC